MPHTPPRTSSNNQAEKGLVDFFLPYIPKHTLLTLSRVNSYFYSKVEPFLWSTFNFYFLSEKNSDATYHAELGIDLFVEHLPHVYHVTLDFRQWTSGDPPAGMQRTLRKVVLALREAPHVHTLTVMSFFHGQRISIALCDPRLFPKLRSFMIDFPVAGELDIFWSSHPNLSSVGLLASAAKPVIPYPLSKLKHVMLFKSSQATIIDSRPISHVDLDIVLDDDCGDLLNNIMSSTSPIERLSFRLSRMCLPSAAPYLLLVKNLHSIRVLKVGHTHFSDDIQCALAMDAVTSLECLVQFDWEGGSPRSQQIFFQFCETNHSPIVKANFRWHRGPTGVPFRAYARDSPELPWHLLIDVKQ